MLQLLADGRQPKEVAVTLSLKIETIKSHTKAIRRKMGVDSTMAAAIEGIRKGIIQ